jgi:cysteinyl-tRNA synthetase
MLRLHDTATGAVRPFELRDPGRVSMYVCGPTVYGPPHLGHGRFTLVYDVVRRYLAFCGLDVRHVCNVTDVDDKIIERAAAEGREPEDVAADAEVQWWAAMDALGALRPTEVPHATRYVPQMVDLVADLVRRGAAYETGDGVYLSVEAVEGYGLLAHQPLASLRSGARVDVDDEKRSPLDFALWKKAKPGEPSWDSPWGPGRPGWHTECVVMSLDLLGEGFDLHGGGQDLIFPHHENERAQAAAAGREFARFWLHYALVVVRGGEKMSKSLRNFTTLSELVTTCDPRAYRLLVLRSHYRSPIEVTPDTIADAEKGLDRLDGLARRLALGDPLDGAPGGVVVREQAVAAAPDGVDEDAVTRFCDRMDDDLDVPGAMAGVFDLVSRAHAAADAGAHEVAARLGRTAALLCGALGLRLRGDAGDVDATTQRLVDERDAARAERDFARADALRDQLAAAGWTVEDGPDGTVVRR